MMKVNFQNDLKYGTLGPDEPQPVSQDELNTIRPEVGGIEALGAMAQLSSMDSTTRSILQHAELSDAEDLGGEVLTPKQLNENYPGLPNPFTEAKTDAVAKIIAERQLKRKELAETIAAGPQGRLFGTARLIAAMVPHAIDPVNIAAGIGVSAVTAGFGGIITEGLEVGSAAAKAVEAASVFAKVNPNVARFAVHTAEGIVGNAIGEVAVARSAYQEGREYSVEEAFKNTVGGAVLVPGVVLGFNKAKLGIKYLGKSPINRSAEMLNRVDPKYSEMAHNTSVARLLQDKLPSTDVIKEQAVKELQGDLPTFAKTPEYIREPLNPDRPLYAATYEQGSIRDVQTEVPDEFFGDAVYMSDDARVANGAGARSIKEGNGRVLELASDDLKLIDLNQPAPPEVAKVFGEFGVTVDEKNPLMNALKEIQDKIQSDQLEPDALNKLNEGLKTAGFDGYVHDGANVEGVPRDPHNSIAVFNKEKLREVAEHAPEPDRLGKVDPERITQLQKEAQSPLSQLTHEAPEAQALAVERLIEEPVRPDKLVEIQAREAEVMDGLTSLERQGLLDEGDLKEVNAIRESAADSETILQHIKDAASCLLMGDD